MSRSVDLFIRSPKAIEEIAQDMGRLTRMTFEPGDMPGTWSLEEGEVRAELRAHPYVNDGELMFEGYQFALSARVAGPRTLANSAEAALLRDVAESLRKGGIDTLLVLDLQYRDHGRAPAAAPESAPAPAEGEEPAAPAEAS